MFLLHEVSTVNFLPLKSHQNRWKTRRDLDFAVPIALKAQFSTPHRLFSKSKTKESCDFCTPTKSLRFGPLIDRSLKKFLRMLSLKNTGIHLRVV